MMKNKIFKWWYIGFAGLMAALALVGILCVRGLLVEYEAARPERQAEAAMAQLQQQAQDAADFWKTYQMPSPVGGSYEKGLDIQKNYLAYYQGELNYVAQPSPSEDELCYLIRSESFPLAEVRLKATGPIQTKLAVFTMREWKIQSIKPVLMEREYSVTVPQGFQVSANGIPLAEGKDTDNGRTQFTLSGVYLEPQFTITNADGKQTGYEIKNFRVVPDIYDYTLTLPATLKVTVNGQKSEGVALSGGRLRHDILKMEKPTVEITDLYGNKTVYNGENKIPLTYTTLTAPQDYTVRIDGKEIPAAAVTEGAPAEWAMLEGLVEGLPCQKVYAIAILKDGAKLSVTDGAGKAVALEQGKISYNLVPAPQGAESVPEAIADQVNVLQVAKNWSLFMSNDRTFNQMKKEMLQGSKQYEEARKYYNSVDRQFFSSHTLLSPAFTDEKVCNFVQITEDCFSVDVSFTKHMRLTSGKQVDDAMNDRFYFVRSGGEWLLAGLKEVPANA